MIEMRHKELVSLLDLVRKSDDPVDADIAQRLPEFVSQAEPTGYTNVPTFLIFWPMGLIHAEEYWEEANR